MAMHIQDIKSLKELIKNGEIVVKTYSVSVNEDQNPSIPYDYKFMKSFATFSSKVKNISKKPKRMGRGWMGLGRNMNAEITTTITLSNATKAKEALKKGSEQLIARKTRAVTIKVNNLINKFVEDTGVSEAEARKIFSGIEL